MTLSTTCDVAVMMRGPPAAPTTSRSLPAGSTTIVGDIALSMRLPG